MSKEKLNEITNDFEYSVISRDIKNSSYGEKDVIKLWNDIDDESTTYMEYSERDIAYAIVFLLDLYNNKKQQLAELQALEEEHRKENGELRKEYQELDENFTLVIIGKERLEKELKQEKEKNDELATFIEAIEECKKLKKPVIELIHEMNKFDDELISKDKIKPFIKAIESWADYIQEDEGCYYKGLNKLAQKLNDTLDGKITPNEKELCVEYELLE